MQALVGGKGKNVLLTPDDEGGEFALGCLSAYLHFRPQTGTCRLYWSQQDYDLDRDYLTLNGDKYPGELPLPIAATSIWLRGEAEIELCIVRHQS